MMKQIALLLIISSMFTYPVMCQADAETTLTTASIVKDANVLNSPFLLELLDRTHDAFATTSCKSGTCTDDHGNTSNCSITCQSDQTAYCRCSGGEAYCQCGDN
jgi:hypothetical protein